MELFKYVSKDGNICSVHACYHGGICSLHVDGSPYGYYRREQDVKGAGTRLKKKLIKSGCTILYNDKNSKWTNDFGDGLQVH